MNRWVAVLCLLLAAAAAVAQVRPLASFASDYRPPTFVRETRGSLIVLPIAEARFWGGQGTRMAGIEGGVDGDTLTLVVRSSGGFAEGVSYFLYFFPVRAPGATSLLTLELVPSIVGRAVAAAWLPDRAEPLPAGRATVEGDALRWTFAPSELPEELAQVGRPTTTVDLTSAVLDEASGAWEEFYFTTFSIGDLTR